MGEIYRTSEYHETTGCIVVALRVPIPCRVRGPRYSYSIASAGAPQCPTIVLSQVQIVLHLDARPSQ